MHWRVPQDWIATMREVLAAEGRAAALPFVVAVTEQATRHHGHSNELSGPSGGEPKIADEVLAVLRDPVSRQTAERLAGNAPLLAGVFQNIDLLHDHGYGDADAVSRGVMEALALLDESG